MDVGLEQKLRDKAAAYVEGWDAALKGGVPLVLNRSETIRRWLTEGYDDGKMWAGLTADYERFRQRAGLS